MADKKMGRPVKDQKLEPITLRVDSNIINQLDVIALNMSNETGVSITRTQIVRKILNEYIRDYINKYPDKMMSTFNEGQTVSSLDELLKTKE